MSVCMHGNTVVNSLNACTLHSFRRTNNNKWPLASTQSRPIKVPSLNLQGRGTLYIHVVCPYLHLFLLDFGCGSSYYRKKTKRGATLDQTNTGLYQGICKSETLLVLAENITHQGKIPLLSDKKEKRDYLDISQNIFNQSQYGSPTICV